MLEYDSNMTVAMQENGVAREGCTVFHVSSGFQWLFTHLMTTRFFLSLCGFISRADFSPALFCYAVFDSVGVSTATFGD